MDRDRGRDRRSVPLRLPQYQDPDMDILNYDEEQEGVSEVIELKRSVKEFRIRGFSNRIANDLRMSGAATSTFRKTSVSLPEPPREKLVMSEMASFDAKTGLDGYKSLDGAHPSEATAAPTQGDGPQAAHVGFIRVSECQKGLNIYSATKLHKIIFKKWENMQENREEIPCRTKSQVDLDLVALLSRPRQQALNKLEALRVYNNRDRPDQQLTEPSRYVGRGDGEVTKMGAGESYRPAARPRSPRSDTSRFDRDRDRSPRRDRARSPIRDRARSPPFAPDTYNAGGRDRSPLRRRSRSPMPYRSRDRTPPRDMPTWRDRDRARSPIRNRTPPRARSPVRARSPIRARSPVRARSPIRPRSPVRARSPPRRFSPRRVDDRRPRSPRRSDFDERDTR